MSLKIRDTLTPYLKGLRRAILRELDLGLEKSAFEVEGQAKLNIPVAKGGGHARRSVGTKKQGQLSYLVGTAGPEVKSKKYGRFAYPMALEYGTYNNTRIVVGSPDNPRKSWPAKSERGGGRDIMPWLRPAIWSLRERIMGNLRDSTQRALRP